MLKNIYVAYLLLVFAFGFQSVIAQKSSPISPPLGPANFRTTTAGLVIGDLREQVEDKIKGIVDDTNVSLSQSGSMGRLQFKEVKVYLPSKMATQYPDQPNQWYVQTPMRAHIEIILPFPVSNRQLYIPIDINTSCQNWFTGNGTIQVVAYPQPSSLEGGNIVEEILNIKNAVDNRIRNSLPTMTFTSITTPFRCTTLGVIPGNAPNYSTGLIPFDLPAAPVPTPPFPGVGLNQTVEVTYLKLKRLRARDFSGNILYEQYENVQLETFANHTFRNSPWMMMMEDQEAYLNMSPVSIKTKTFDKMIVIANIKQQTPGSGIPDSNYEINYSSADFSPGIHTIKITKLFSHLFQNKVVYTRVPAYELTYRVRSSIIAPTQ